MLRQSYSASLRNAVHTEIDKDYVKMPSPEIEKHFAGRCSAQAFAARKARSAVSIATQSRRASLGSEMKPLDW